MMNNQNMINQNMINQNMMNQNMNAQNMYHQNMNHQNMNQAGGQYIMNMSYANVNPKNFDPKIKNKVINDNIYHSNYGNYKICPTYGSVKFPYGKSFKPGAINNICNVFLYNKHALDVANMLCEHGLNSLTSRKPVPVIVYPMGSDFFGSNFESREGISDENIILRTNYPYVIKKQAEQLFPMKDEQKAVIYSNPITVIRDSNYNPLVYDDLFKVAIITMCYDRKDELTVEKLKNKKDKNEKNDKNEKHRDIKMLSSEDLLNLEININNVCQAAIGGFTPHDVLILSVFGQEFSIPIDDQILMFNTCIMNYGHRFNKIIICVPPYEEKGMFEYLDKCIIKPQILTKDIEMKYQAEAMRLRMNRANDNEASRSVASEKNKGFENSGTKGTPSRRARSSGDKMKLSKKTSTKKDKKSTKKEKNTKNSKLQAK
jgi:hypothetical protein